MMSTCCLIFAPMIIHIMPRNVQQRRLLESSLSCKETAGYDLPAMRDMQLLVSCCCGCGSCSKMWVVRQRRPSVCVHHYTVQPLLL